MFGSSWLTLWRLAGLLLESLAMLGVLSGSGLLALRLWVVELAQRDSGAG